MALVRTLELLFDGRIKVVFFSGASTYLIPLMVANSFPDILLMRLSGQPATFVNIDTTIETIDGVAFVGTFDNLETLIRDLANQSNIIFTGSVLNGGGDATAANQELTINAIETVSTNQETQISDENLSDSFSQNIGQNIIEELQAIKKLLTKIYQ